LFSQLLLYVGFRLGCHSADVAPLPMTLPLYSGTTAIKYLLTVYVLTFPISYAYRMGYAPSDLGGIVRQLAAGLQDPHFAYASAIDKTNQSPIPWSIYFAISIFNQLVFIAGFILWRQLTRVSKVVFAILVGIDLFYWVAIATTFGVISIATTFGLSSMFWRRGVAGQGAARLARNVLLLGVLLLASIAFFSYNLYRRSGFVEIDVSRSEIAQRPITLDHTLLAIVPAPLQATYINVVSYFAQGYYHTCLAMDLDFEPTAFLGSNPALISLAQAFGVDVWSGTYMHRLRARGVDEYGVWHSAYTWYASDVSFYGVPIVLFLIAFFFGFSWMAGLRGDFLSRAVFIMFGNMLLFLFANNTYLSSVFYTFMLFVPLWICTRVLGLAWGVDADMRLGVRPTDETRRAGLP
jgi:hypothetical protein